MSTWRVRRGFPYFGVMALLGLSACGTSPPPSPSPSPVPEVGRTTGPVIPAGAREYRVAPAESLLRILVYRGGAMARLGHNHVIASHDLEGSVYLTQDVARTGFDIRIPVNELTVDEPALREAAGPDFPRDVPQSAREGTRRNLLSQALLDGANHPAIRLRGTGIDAVPDSPELAVEITFKERVFPLRVPVHVERRGDAVVARGEFPLRQSELGLTPFSVAMGTLVVMDEMKIQFEVVARAP